MQEIDSQLNHVSFQDFITSSMRTTEQFQSTTDNLRTQAKYVSDLLNTYSIPFFSTRYMGHMCMEM